MFMCAIRAAARPAWDPDATALGNQPAQTQESAAANPTKTPQGAQTQAGGLQPPAYDSIPRNRPMA